MQCQVESWQYIVGGSHRNLNDRYDISISKITMKGAMNIFRFILFCFTLSPTTFVLDLTMGNTVDVLEERGTAFPLQTTGFILPQF